MKFLLSILTILLCFNSFSCTNERLVQLSWEVTGDFATSDVFTAENRMKEMPVIQDDSINSVKYGDYTYTVIEDLDDLKNDGLDNHKTSVIQTYEDMEMDYRDSGVAVKVEFFNEVFEATKFAFITFKKHSNACEWVGVSGAYLDFDN